MPAWRRWLPLSAWVVGKAEIVVTGQVDDLVPVVVANRCLLVVEDAELEVRALGSQVFKRGGEMGKLWALDELSHVDAPGVIDAGPTQEHSAAAEWPFGRHCVKERTERWPWCTPAGYNKGLRRGKRRVAAGRMCSHSGELEQVHVRGLNCRSLRLQSAAGLGLVLAMATLPLAAAAQRIATYTTMNVETSDQGGYTKATASVAVTAADGQPATGTVVINDGDRELAEAALNSQGQATAVVSLSGGDHALSAIYVGDASHLSSASVTNDVSAQASSTPDFTLSLTPVPPSTLPLTVTAAGQAPLPSP